MVAKNSPRFPLGQIVATPGALAVLAESGESASVFLKRHNGGDWGQICQDDKNLNDAAIEEGERLLSEYKTRLGKRIWIITEADRSVTTILLPEEY